MCVVKTTRTIWKCRQNSGAALGYSSSANVRKGRNVVEFYFVLATENNFSVNYN